MKEVKISKQAFDADQEAHYMEKSRQCSTLNGMIVTDSESAQTLDPTDRQVMDRRVAAIKRTIRRKRAKYIANQHFLQRCKSKNLNTIVRSYPDIGSTIEEFVESCNVGANAWQRTGLLTFDRNMKIEKKCTY